MAKFKEIRNIVLVLGCVIALNICGCGNKHSATSNSEEDNILMDESKANSYKVLGSDLTRREVITVTFLDSLDEITDESWDVSADGDKEVMAWTKWRDNGGYDLYIGAEGGVTANKNSSGLFSGYTNIEQILFNDNFHTENAQDMSAMFLFCNNLKGLDISHFDTSNVTDMSSMFGCESLEELDVSHFDTSNVTDMNGMFAGCSSLRRLDVSHFDTSNVTDMAYMFTGCESLGELDVTHFNTSNVTDMTRMFYCCRNLVKLDVSGFNTSNVTDTQAMFGRSDNLTDLNVSNFDPDLVRTMYWFM